MFGLIDDRDNINQAIVDELTELIRMDTPITIVISNEVEAINYYNGETYLIAPKWKLQWYTPKIKHKLLSMSTDEYIDRLPVEPPEFKTISSKSVANLYHNRLKRKNRPVFQKQHEDLIRELTEYATNMDEKVTELKEMTCGFFKVGELTDMIERPAYMSRKLSFTLKNLYLNFENDYPNESDVIKIKEYLTQIHNLKDVGGDEDLINQLSFAGFKVIREFLDKKLKAIEDAYNILQEGDFI